MKVKDNIRNRESDLKVRDYIRDRASLILLMVFSFLFVAMFLLLTGTNRDIIWFITVFYLMIFGIYFTFHFLFLRNKFKKIESTMKRLEKKYLIADIVKDKGNNQQQFYWELVRRACKSMMDELNQQEKQNLEYKEYIDSWIHEVKTPITAIQLMCDNERNTVTDKIKLETKKVEMDIERVLYYSKSGDTWKDYVIARHSLADIVEASIMKIYQLFIYHGIKITIEIEKEVVYTDAKWSSFIITQILLNCIQYRKDENPTIRIYVIKEKESTSLVIEDNGLGIKSEEIGKIFEKGYVGTNGRKNETSSGMGMFICSKLCTKLGIGIHADSEYGTYTKMILTYGEGTFYMPEHEQ